MALQKLVDGRAFLEGPRWHNGALYASDMHADEVIRVSETGDVTSVLTVGGQPSGLGWMPDGSMLVVSMTDRVLLRVSPEGDVALHADLSTHIAKRANDMVVDAKSRAYIGNFGFDFDFGEGPASTVLLRVDPDGSVHVVADGMMFPNGMVITQDGKTLIAAQTFARELTAFDIAEDGSLSNRRTWAAMPEGAVPDGICLDEAGGVWVASPTTNNTIRVLEGGEVTDRISTAPHHSIACMLGGADGKTLHILTAESTHRNECKEKMSAAILTTRVEHAAAGRP